MMAHRPACHAPDTLALVDADVDGVGRTVVRISGMRIIAVGEPARSGDRRLDLRGDRLLPGLINAHDHLPLNHLPRLEPVRRYRNVREWIADVDRQRHVDGPLRAALAVPLSERLLLGGMKNLLSGVTTVAHHDPLYPALCECEYPVHVVTRYGWAHSLPIDGETKVRESFRRTSADWPWIIHAAEGVDEEAAGEFAGLERLGCLKANTLIVHGTALGRAERRRLAAASAGLIWCPASNLHLFGAAAEVASLLSEGRVALGTDSRLSGSQDLLAELGIASECVAIGARALESLVTRDAARLLRLHDRGALAPGARADLLILPRSMPLARARRSDVRLVMVDGIALYGDADYAHALGPSAAWVEVGVDGRAKALRRSLAERLSRLQAREHGLELPALAGRAA